MFFIIECTVSSSIKYVFFKDTSISGGYIRAIGIKTGNKAVLKKIAQLTRAILENAHTGIGKPEALKYDLAPKWSRRISGEHRYIYLVKNDTLFVYSLKGHYE